MTEEIIVDGVNVAGCISFDKNNGYNICCYDDTREDKIPFANFCIENKDCYYKQLKRLEQERDELKKACEKCKLFDIEKTNRNLLERLDKLEQENKELRKANEISIEKVTVTAEAKRLQELERENRELKKEMQNRGDVLIHEMGLKDEYQDDYIFERIQKDKYRSALEKINRTLLGVRGLSINCDKQIIKVKAIINEVLE